MQWDAMLEIQLMETRMVTHAMGIHRDGWGCNCMVMLVVMRLLVVMVLVVMLLMAHLGVMRGMWTKPTEAATTTTTYNGDSSNNSSSSSYHHPQ